MAPWPARPQAALVALQAALVRHRWRQGRHGRCVAQGRRRAAPASEDLDGWNMVEPLSDGTIFDGYRKNVYTYLIMYVCNVM